MNADWPLPKIGSFQPQGHFFLAPMEAVNCASFRLLCKDRGAALIYTDMIDADVFYAYAKEHGTEKALEHYLNAQEDEQPLAIQLGGPYIESLKFCIEAMRPYATTFDLNIGCPLGYMLGKKGGCYLMKHPDQLYKLLRALREIIDIPFTIKIRSGWDEESKNAIEIAKEAEKIGVDAIAVHARTRKQRYQDKADWRLVKAVKDAVKIPVIVSGDVFNPYTAWKARKVTNADYVMVARGAKANPSVFSLLKKWEETLDEPPLPLKTYEKDKVNPYQDFCDFLSYYKTREKRYRFSELRDHTLWTASDCMQATRVKEHIMTAETEEELLNILNSARF